MEKFLTGLLIVVLLFIVVFSVVFSYTNEQTVTCEISDKWVKRVNKGEDTYLVSCGDTVYKIEDLFWIGKFNSSDIYADLEVGTIYDFKVTGHRIPFFSEYQNINEYKVVEE